VLVEDKLFRNPQARREVVAQILDYATVLEVLDPQALIEEVAADAQQWLEDQVPQLKRILVTSDFLLLITGDDILPSAAQLVERMARDCVPVSNTDVAMLGLSLFQDGDRVLLVPNVIGGVVGSQRELRVRVEVSTADLPVRIPMAVQRVQISDTAQDDSGDALDSAHAAAFFGTDAWVGHGEDAARIQQFFQTAGGAGITGIRVSTTESGRPTIHLDGTRVGTLKVLAAMNSRRGLWDSLVAREARKIEADPATEQAVAAFRSRLVQLGFSQHPSKRTEANVGVVSTGQSEIIEALGSLAASIRAS
jgi:hypothetical protein